MKLAAQQLVDDPVYRRNLRIAQRDRSVAPMIEAMLWYYAKGKPKESFTVDGTVNFHDAEAFMDSLSHVMNNAG